MEGAERIEAQVADVVAEVPEWIWDRRSLPVPVEDIADSCFGLWIREVEAMGEAPGAPALAEGQTLSGLLLAGRREIWVNAWEAREWPGRRRFTIGHELGHWVMHQDGQTSLFCRHGSVEEVPAEEKAGRPPLDPIEEEANVFAANLLMPAELLRHHYRETGGDFERLCALFNASGAAMGRRLHQVI
jgi:hypothetical protein